MKNKKLFSIVLLCTFCFALSACSNNDKTDPTKNDTKNEETNTGTTVESTNESENKPETETEKETETESEKETNDEKVSDTNENKNHNGKFSANAYDVVTVREKLYDGDIDGKKLAFLTFDDGPNNDVTPRILDILKEKNVPATFFTVGKAIHEDTANVLKRIYNEGHAIATHSFSHEYEDLYPGRYPNAEYILKEEKKSIERLKSFLGEEFYTKVFRYPGGHMSWNKEGLKASDKLLQDNNIYWIDWNSMTGDAQPKNIKQVPRPETVQKVLDNFDESARLNGVSNVAVILMHDAIGKEITVEALPNLIDHLQKLGYEFGIIE